jgi:MYXO-CTERM domain-containing protein
MPPPVPVLLAPADGAVVATGAPTLSWSNAADPDGDPVTYDLEIYADDVNGAPVQSADAIAEDASGTTTFVPTTIPENTRVWWRVRARTAAVGGFSPWSAYNRFLVDTANDAPEVPVLVKPAEGETVAMRRPGLSVLNVEDPEDDAVEFLFEVARDADFAEIVWSSQPVAQNTVSATTMSSTDVDLDWGGDYHARVRARDVRGGTSDWSDPHRFRLKTNLPPGTPAWDAACVASIYTDDAPTSLLVRNVEDPEGETVLFEVEFFRFEDDPLQTFPVYMTSAPMAASGDTTAIPIDVSGLPNGRYRYFVRAFDGSDASGAIECELTLDLPPPGDASGGCCSSGGPDPRALAGLLLLTVLGLRSRRRRPARR